MGYRIDYRAPQTPEREAALQAVRCAGCGASPVTTGCGCSYELRWPGWSLPVPPVSTNYWDERAWDKWMVNAGFPPAGGGNAQH